MERFAALFSGYTKAFGTYDLTQSKTDAKGKVVGKPITVRGDPGLGRYESHLKGSGPGLGVIMLRDDDTVMFGAIDYDNPQMDHAKAEAAIRRLQLPLVLCRSKSGGGHFYCFTEEPVPALIMQERLDEWKALLGMAAQTETFPKQTARFNENDIGNWINLPYHSALDTNRYAFREGEPVPFGAFLDLAEASRVSREVLERTLGPAKAGEEMFPEGPPCLQHCAAMGGFPEGTRNLGMQQAIVYLKRAHPDDWASRVDPYNAKLAELGSAEIQHLIKSNTRKDYNYQCKQPPINAYCQRKVCLGRMYGVGEGLAEARRVEIGGLIRYDSPMGDEPLWSMDVDGKRVMVTNSQFYSRDEFNRQAMAQANVVPIHMPPQRWLKYLNDLIQNADVVQLPEDASPTGQLWEHLTNFTHQSVTAMEREEVWLGKLYREGGRVYFRSQDMFRYLDSRKVKYKSEQAVWTLLREKGGDREFWNLAGRGVNVWHLPVTDFPSGDELAEKGKRRMTDADEEF